MAMIDSVPTCFAGSPPCARPHGFRVGYVAAQQLAKFSIGPVFLASVCVVQTCVAVAVDLRNHLAAGLVPLPMIGLLFQLLQDPISGRPVLESKLGHDPAKGPGFGLPHGSRRSAEKEEKLAESVHYPTVHNVGHLNRNKSY